MPALGVDVVLSPGIERAVPTDGVVTLRIPEERDVDSLVSACSDADIIRFTRVPTPYRRTDTEAFIRPSREGLERGDAFAFVIAAAVTNDLAGHQGAPNTVAACVAQADTKWQKVAERERGMLGEGGVQRGGNGLIRWSASRGVAQPG